LLRNAVDSLSGQRQQLGLSDGERFFNVAAGAAAQAGVDGLTRIDHVLASERGDNLFSVQGALHDPAHKRSRIDMEQASQVPARVSAGQLREQEQQQQGQTQQAERQQRAAQL